MSRLKLIIISLATVLLGATGLASTALASAVHIGQEDGAAAVTKDTVVDGSAYVAAPSVRVSGVVNGDVYCAGNTITVDGTVNGDVICAGNTITIDGTVHGDVRLAGAAVVLSGAVNGNASIFASDARVEESARIGGDLNGGVASLMIDGVIGRDMTAGVGVLTLNGTISRDVMAGLGNVRFGDEASVGGVFAYSSDAELSIPANVVAGETQFTRTSHNASQQAETAAWFFFIALISVAFLAVLGAMVVPRLVHASGDVSWGRFGFAAVVGLTAVIVTPTAALLLAITGIGMYAAYVLFLLWLLVMAAAPIPFAYFIGTKIYGARSNNILVRATIGALALVIVLVLPVVNILAFMLMLIVGVGLFLLQVPSLYKNDPYVIPSVATKKKKAA